MLGVVYGHSSFEVTIKFMVKHCPITHSPQQLNIGSFTSICSLLHGHLKLSFGAEGHVLTQVASLGGLPIFCSSHSGWRRPDQSDPDALHVAYSDEPGRLRSFEAEQIVLICRNHPGWPHIGFWISSLTSDVPLLIPESEATPPLPVVRRKRVWQGYWYRC